MQSLKQSSPSCSDHSDARTDFPLDRRSSSAAFTTASSCLPARFPLWISRRISRSSPSGDNPERARTACTAKNSGRSRVTLLLSPPPCTMVCSAGQGIGLAHRTSWSVVHGKIKPGKVMGPPSLAAVELLRCHEVLQVLVVRPDFKLVTSPFQEMAPVFQSSDDC